MLPRQGSAYALADIEKAISERLPESETLEYKADPAGRLETVLAKTVSAFANSGGGTLVLGVAESPSGEPSVAEPPGLPASYGRVSAGEHVDRLISTRVQPRPSARVEAIPIPNTDRAYIVVSVAPRGGGPHRIVSTSDPALNGRYYVRHGRQSEEADHYMLRQLFAEAGESAIRVQEYLRKHGHAPIAELAGAEGPATLLAHHQLDVTATSPRLVESLGRTAVAVAIPEILRGDVIDLDREDVRALIRAAPNVFAYGRSETATLEGRLFEDEERFGLLRSFVDVHRVGYVAAGHSISVLKWKDEYYFSATRAMRTMDLVLDLARRLFDVGNVLDRVHVGLYLTTTSGAWLFIGKPEHRRGRAVPNSIAVTTMVSRDELAEKRGVLRFIDKRLANAFGVEDGLAVDDDGTISTIELPGFF